LRLARSILGDRDSAEDVVQESLLAAWTHIAGFRGDSALSTWLHTITVRACTRRLKRDSSVEPVGLLTESEQAWMTPRFTVDPAEVVARAASADELGTVLAGLPAPYRVALVLHDVEGLPAHAVADATGVPLGTAKSRIRRGRMALVYELSRRHARDETGEMR
jgi:RNA polymerase sigma-70 factor (ECF subfamily)